MVHQPQLSNLGTKKSFSNLINDVRILYSYFYSPLFIQDNIVSITLLYLRQKQFKYLHLTAAK